MMRLVLPLSLLFACSAEQEPLPDGTSPTASTTVPEVCGPDAKKGLKVGKCAPDFLMPDRFGEDFSLHAQRGKVALVDISALW